MRFLAAALVFAALPLLSSCTKPAGDPAPDKLTPIKEQPGEVRTGSLREISGQSTSIKARKNKDGTYSWEITGKDAESIIEADRKLRAGLTDKSPAKRGPDGHEK